MHLLDAVETQSPMDRTHLQAFQTLYRFAALALADPRIGSGKILANRGTQRLVNAAAGMLRDDAAHHPGELGWGERPVAELVPQEVFSLLPASNASLNADYERLFGLLVSCSCPPYETEYIDSKLSFQRSNTLADLAGYYRAFGWTPSLTNPERPDHISLELEFIATLCGMTLNAGDSDQAAICRDAQASFLTEHLVWWVPALGKLLAYEDPKGYYGAVGRFLPALFPFHRALLGLPPHRGPAQPSLIERPDECDGCLLQPSELG